MSLWPLQSFGLVVQKEQKGVTASDLIPFLDQLPVTQQISKCQRCSHYALAKKFPTPLEVAGIDAN
jgi:hypothetical protein